MILLQICFYNFVLRFFNCEESEEDKLYMETNILELKNVAIYNHKYGIEIATK